MDLLQEKIETKLKDIQKFENKSIFEIIQFINNLIQIQKYIIKIYKPYKSNEPIKVILTPNTIRKLLEYSNYNINKF